MNAVDLAKDFMAAPSEQVLEKIIELVKENPQAAVAIIGILGIGYVAKSGIESIGNNK